MEQHQLGGRSQSGSHHTSSNSSLNQMSDNDMDNYEPVAHFLSDPPQLKGDGGVRISLGGSSDGAGGGTPSTSNRMSTSSFNAPAYPAPLPPREGNSEVVKRKSIVAVATGGEDGEANTDD